MTSSNVQTAWQDFPAASGIQPAFVPFLGPELGLGSMGARDASPEQTGAFAFSVTAVVSDRFVSTPSKFIVESPWSGTKNLRRNLSTSRRQTRVSNRHVVQIIERLKRNNAVESREQLETRWLSQNRQRFAGQWIAIVGDRLVATSTLATEVFALTRGMDPRPMIMQIEHEDLPFAGW